MAVVQIYPDPPILRFKDNLKLKRIQSKNENCWEQCITEEFPVDSEVIVSDGKVVCNIGPPHPGCLMEATLNHNVFVGKAVIRDPNNLTLAEFRYSGGVANGKCTLYYPSGEVYFQGELVNGYRSGFGREYDKRGNEVYAGFFKHGVRDEHIIKIDDMKDFWVETNKRGEVISICHKNGKGENEGPCIFYENGKVTAIDIVDAAWEFSENGKPLSFKEIEGSLKTLKADYVFIAMGFLGVDANSFVKDINLEVDKRGRVESLASQGIFTCGDMRTGQSLVVRAMADAKNIAKNVDEYLKGL